MEKEFKNKDFSDENDLKNNEGNAEPNNEAESGAKFEDEPETETKSESEVESESENESKAENTTESLAKSELNSKTAPPAKPNIFVYIKKAPRILLLAFEAAAAILFASQMPLGIRNIGAVFGLCLSLFALLVTALFKQAVKLLKKLWKNKAGKTAAIIFFSVFGILAAYAVTLSSLMLGGILDTPRNPDAVIVLGCRVQKNGKPSLMLRRRIEAAFDYLTENREVICIVSGGQGEDEPISEAESMKVTLVEMGIAEDRIFIEDKSENTRENIEFSAKLLNEMGIDLNEAAIVTDGFHLYRASLLAGEIGLDASSVPADTPWWLAPSYWFREWFALSSLFVFG